MELGGSGLRLTAQCFHINNVELRLTRAKGQLPQSWPTPLTKARCEERNGFVAKWTATKSYPTPTGLRVSSHSQTGHMNCMQLPAEQKMQCLENEESLPFFRTIWSVLEAELGPHLMEGVVRSGLALILGGFSVDTVLKLLQELTNVPAKL